LVYLPSMTRSPTCHSDVVLEHYRRVAGSLTFGNTLKADAANHENS
jgi:hypothetical protein